MGRKYYCDYCDKRIPPGLYHRKNHNQSIQHMNNKHKYYLQFKEPIQILYDERTKKICNQWTQTGTCLYGNYCKYSHRINYQLIQLIQQQTFFSLNKQTNFDVQRWIQKKIPGGIIVPLSLVG